jgi:hypothetical protein
MRNYARQMVGGRGSWWTSLTVVLLLPLVTPLVIPQDEAVATNRGGDGRIAVAENSKSSIHCSPTLI